MLNAARHVFAERGFDAATIRAIAASAGVDPALVHHYFGTKDALFLAAVQVPLDPEDVLPTVLAAAPHEVGHELVLAVVRIWDGPVRAAGLAVLRSALGSEWAASLLREFLVARVVRRIVVALDVPVPEQEARGALVASQMIGLVMIRYVLRVEPLASASPDAVAAALGPTLQRYLTGEVAGIVPPRSP